VSAAIAGLGGRCTMVDSYYMVPVVDGDDVVRVVKALGVDHIATLAAADVTEDIVMRLPRTEGFVEKLARPAGNVEILIGMDNQGWMPMHVESSRCEDDNLRLMKSVLSPRCILIGSVRTPDQGRGTQGSVVSPPTAIKQPGGRMPDQGRDTQGSVVSTPVAIKQPGGRRSGFQPRNSMRVMMTMMLLMLAGLPECVAFRAYDCNSQSSQIEQYSLLDPDSCGNMEKVHAIERELYGEIVQIKKERLVQVTRCTVTQTIKSVYSGWQSRTGPKRYAKFHDPITIEPADGRESGQDRALQAQREGLPVQDERQAGSGR
jgi:hypothetical protein